MKLNNEIIVNKTKGIEYIQFKRLLDEGIKHAYTLKGADLNFRTNSPEEKESYRRVYEALGLDIQSLVKPLQTHTGNVKCIDKVFSRNELQSIDGLITDKEGITLTSTNADCILLLFYDPKKKVIANVHSGWKGTFQKISEKTVEKMKTNYKCNPEDIECYICPSIRKCHFEVDEDVKELCEDIFGFIPNKESFISTGEIKEGKQKYYIDTVYITKYLLKEAGLKDKNIIDCEICSVCDNDKINSFRAEGKGYKLSTAVITLD